MKTERQGEEAALSQPLEQILHAQLIMSHHEYHQKQLEVG